MIRWTDVATWAETLPETTVESWYGTPGLKVAGKGFARFRCDEEGGVVLYVTHEEKQSLLALGNPAFYTTPHYDGYAWIIVDLDLVPCSELEKLLRNAREPTMPTRLRKLELGNL